MSNITEVFRTLNNHHCENWRMKRGKKPSRKTLKKVARAIARDMPDWRLS